jgi:hypothetical protein
VIVTPTGGDTLTVEGGVTDTYTLVLNILPEEDVTVTVTPDAQVQAAPSVLVFTATDWDQPQTVTVSAVDDPDVEDARHDGVLTHAVTSADDTYNGIAVSALTATVVDDDRAPAVVIVESGGSTDVAEGGATDTYTLVLDSPPAADVTITTTPDAQVSTAPVSRTFTAADWYLPQSVTVSAVDDADKEFAHTGTITHACTSGDGAYDGLAVDDVVASVADNEAGGPISGTISYTNRIYTPASGFTGATDELPVRHAEFEIVQSPSTVLASGVTDESGDFSVEIPYVGTEDLFVRVYARRRDSTSGVAGLVEAVVRSSSVSVYTASSSTASLDTGVAHDIDLVIPLGSSSPFNIFDAAVLTQQLLQALEPTLEDPPLVTLYWAPGSTGTYFNPGNNSVYLLGSSSDPDDFDDDIIQHELGHYVSCALCRDDSPGGSHSLTGHYDIRLTWSEGWAHFWSAAVRQWANANVAPSERYPDYVWQVDNRTSTSAWRIDTPSFASSAYGADNEVSVAAILWNISAGAGDGGSLDLGNDEIWDVVRNRFDARYNPLGDERWVTLEDFHDEWYAASYDDLALILSSRTVRYELDADDNAAANDDAPSAVKLVSLPATRSTRTFFKTGSDPVGDEDWYSFDATDGQAYRVQTSDLGDGADTYLHVYRDDDPGPDVDLVLIDEDDDGGSGIASRVDFTATADAPYYIKVSPYPGDPPYPDSSQVATYGSYTLSVTAP